MAFAQFYKDILTMTVAAAATFTGGQPVSFSGTAPAALGACNGIALHDGVSGDQITILTVGQIQLKASNATIAAGDAIECAGSGVFRTLTTGKRVGIALGAAAANGYFEALVDIGAQ